METDPEKIQPNVSAKDSLVAELTEQLNRRLKLATDKDFSDDMQHFSNAIKSGDFAGEATKNLFRKVGSSQCPEMTESELDSQTENVVKYFGSVFSTIFPLLEQILEKLPADIVNPKNPSNEGV